MSDKTLQRALLPYVAMGAFLIVIVWAIAYRSIVVEREKTLMQSAEQAERLASFFEEHVLKIFGYSDTYLKLARREILEHGSIDYVRKLIAGVPLDRSIVSHITVIDETGKPLWISDHAIKPGTSAKDRGYFKFHQENEGDQVFISLPLQGRNTGKLTIRLVRRIDKPDGRFGGVIFASIDVAQITEFLAAMNLGARSSATLVGTDKKIRARSSYGAVGPGQDISGSRLWRELAQSAVGLYKQRSVVDDVTRYYAYRRLSEFPLIVAIGVAAEDVSGAATAFEIPAYVIAALVSLVIAIMMAAVCRDIQTRKTNENRLREILEKSPMGVAVISHGPASDQIVPKRLFTNEALARMIGFSSADELTKSDVADSWVDHQQMERASKIMLDGGDLNNFECQRRRRDGAECWILMNSRPIRFDNRPCTMIWHLDITERKAAEASLRQAQKMEAVGQLTGGLAHDFNNLLAVILGNSEILSEKAGRDEKIGRDDKSLKAITRAGRRGSELTHRLLAFSRQQSLTPRAIDLAALVSGMSEMLARSLGETIEIEIEASPDLRTALADPGQVESALLNLALNARDAMPSGGKLTIECSNAWLDEAYVARNPGVEAGAYVMLAVSDQGSGMSPEVLEHALEPFFTTKEVGQGSGLGLSMVYGFAQQSGGHVKIYSEGGLGTTVKLYLPQARPSTEPEAARRGEDVPRGKGERILVIEDDPDVRALAVGLLRHLGYMVVSVSDAAAAREALAQGEAVDLVLSDVVLPGGVSGPELAEEIHKTYPDLKIILMSGYPAEAAKRNGFLGSGSVLLNKPFQRHQLAEVLRKALD